MNEIYLFNEIATKTVASLEAIEAPYHRNDAIMLTFTDGTRIKLMSECQVDDIVYLEAELNPTDG